VTKRNDVSTRSTSNVSQNPPISNSGSLTTRNNGSRDDNIPSLTKNPDQSIKSTTPTNLTKRTHQVNRCFLALMYDTADS
jgi:hypothetical protein